MVGVIVVWFFVLFFKQKTAYEMRIRDWSSDVCSSDLLRIVLQAVLACVGLDELIHAGRTVARFGAAVLGQVDRHRNRRVFKRQVYRFVLVVIGVGNKD